VYGILIEIAPEGTLQTEIREKIYDNLKHLSEPDAKRVFILLEELDKREFRSKTANNFIDYTKTIWPEFISGTHHKIMADAFDRIVGGDLKRLIVNMPPRHTKSEFASWLLPSYFLGKYPDKKLIQASHTAELAQSFGRRVRNLIDSEEYKDIFPGVLLSSDSKSAGRWNTDKGGSYFAIGVGGAIAGRGADLFIIDDPHSEQDAYGNDSKSFDLVHEWFTSGPRQRLQPNGAIVIVMTRWHKNDLTGKILKDSLEREGSDEWELIEFPAILPSGSPVWPEYWSEDLLLSLKAELPVGKWMAQYMQNPSAEEGALVKREWWKLWEGDPPPVKYIIMSLDTAFTKNTKNDPTACTVWGIFEEENAETGKSIDSIILLDAWDAYLEFPELKQRVKLEYTEKWKPDLLLIENRGSGQPLIQELRNAGIMCTEFTPTRGKASQKTPDKIVRVNSITDMFSSGIIYRPNKRWAEKVMHQFAEFPNGDHDDYVDSGTQALMRFRQGGFVRLESDDQDDDEEFYSNRRKRRKYY